MAYTAGIAPSVGDTVQAATGVAFGANDDWIRSKADADHDLDISTGTGYHRAKFNAGVRLVNPDAGNESAAQAYLDRNGRLRLKAATGTTTPPTPASDSDGDRVLTSDGIDGVPIGQTTPDDGTFLSVTSKILLNPAEITADLTIPAGHNGLSAGPIAVADGITVTVEVGATWVVA